jgi:hypothetical protein
MKKKKKRINGGPYFKIVIKPCSGLTRLKSQVSGYMGWPKSTRNFFKKIFEVLILHMKKIKKQFMWYRLYMW